MPKGDSERHTMNQLDKYAAQKIIHSLGELVVTHES